MAGDWFEQAVEDGIREAAERPSTQADREEEERRHQEMERALRESVEENEKAREDVRHH